MILSPSAHLKTVDSDTHYDPLFFFIKLDLLSSASAQTCYEHENDKNKNKIQNWILVSSWEYMPDLDVADVN